MPVVADEPAKTDQNDTNLPESTDTGLSAAVDSAATAPDPADGVTAAAADGAGPESSADISGDVAHSPAPDQAADKLPPAGNAPANVSAITSRPAPIRPVPGRIVARAGPGATRHLGRQSFRGGVPVRQKFRPSGIPRGQPVPPAVEETPAETGPNPGNVRQAPAAGHSGGPRQHRGGRHQQSGAGRQHDRQVPPADVPAAEENRESSVDVKGRKDRAEPVPPAQAGTGGYAESPGGVVADDSLFKDDAHATSFDVPEDDLEKLDAVEPEEPQPVKRTGPPRDMLINATDKDEVRIAIVSQGVLEELYMERTSTELHVGNIYKGRVVNVEPAIQAAFIDFGIGKNGFLHISDLHPQYFTGRQKRSIGPQRKRGAGQPEAGPDDGEAPEGVYGDIEAGEATAILEDADLEVESDHMLPMEKVGRKTPRRSRPPIQQCLRRGQEIIVQVTKEGIGTKGPTLTSYISVPGRYLVMMPGMSQLGVSRKIEDEDQRRELKKILLDLNPPRNLGFIIRTAGVGRTRRELQQDLHYLVKVWRRIHERLEQYPAPVELYQESDLVIRTIRDLAINDIDRMVVDEPVVAERVRDFLSIVNPRAADFVEAYRDAMPLFQRYGVEREIEKINSRRVEMANGGSLVIDSTEALVAIDVNSGRYREHRDAELTAFNINREAIRDICRHLRLRDLGGVIVIDFIDMREERHKREIERLLRDQLKDDRARTKVLRMSQFCMIEMTRQRVKPSLKRSIYQDCPHCHGSALIKTPESVSLDVLRRLAAGGLHKDVSRMEVRVFTTVAAFLLNRKRQELVELEARHGKRINVAADGSLSGDAVLMEAVDARGNLLNINL